MRVLFIGDSITNGSGASKREHRFSHRVVSQLRLTNNSVTAAAEALAGRTTRDGIAVARSAAFSFSPDVAVVFFGANDQKLTRRGRGRPTVPPDEYQDKLGEIQWHIECAAPGCSVLLVSPVPLPPYLHEPYASAAIALGAVDVTSEYERSWLSKDGWHPDDHGHAFIAAGVLREIESLSSSKA